MERTGTGTGGRECGGTMSGTRKGPEEEVEQEVKQEVDVDQEVKQEVDVEQEVDQEVEQEVDVDQDVGQEVEQEVKQEVDVDQEVDQEVEQEVDVEQEVEQEVGLAMQLLDPEEQLEVFGEGGTPQEDKTPPSGGCGAGGAPPEPPPQTPPGAQQYKAAALGAKLRGDRGGALGFYRVAKSLEQGTHQELPPPPQSLEQGTQRDLPAPPQSRDARQELPPPPTALQVVLEQHMDRYRAALEQAQQRGEGRKERMHQRILKQYQSALHLLRSGRVPDLSELPVPPGSPPLPGLESSGGEQSVEGTLVAAMELLGKEEEEEEEERKPPPPPKAPTAPQPPRAPPAASRTPPALRPHPMNSNKAQLQLLERRRHQLLRAALAAKGREEPEGTRARLREARGVRGLMEAARGGVPIDIAQVPEAPQDPQEFVLQEGGVRVPPETARRYRELSQQLRNQHQLALAHSRHFARLGNVTETNRLELLAEECRAAMGVLRAAHAQGLPPPPHHYQQKTFNIIKTFPELSSTDLELSILRGINFPAPQGVAPSDLDTFVRFEFPFPSAEEAQKDKTPVVRSTRSPEFQAVFKLHLVRGHRGLRRVLHSKGIRLEVVQKGGLFRADRVLGTAQLRLQALEMAAEMRGVLEVLDSLRPTGGHLEVLVRIREPLGPPQLEPQTQRWLSIPPTPPVTPKSKPTPTPPKEGNNGAVSSPPPILSLLCWEREQLQRQIRSPPPGQHSVPPQLRQRLQDLTRRCQSLSSRLQQGDPQFLTEYRARLLRSLRIHTEAARRLGFRGHREAAKEALYRRNLLERELQKLRG